jgi:hypothetical protein
MGTPDFAERLEPALTHQITERQQPVRLGLREKLVACSRVKSSDLDPPAF